MGDHEAPEGASHGYLSDAMYNFFKFVAQILLPALGTLYFALAGIWNLAAPTQVIGTITAVDTFLGVLLGISTSAYNKSDARFGGAINIKQGPEKKVFTLDLHSDPDELEGKKEVTFRINKHPSPGGNNA